VIDLHCHVLPGLDDGALDLEDSVGMARQAEADGIGTICATPHIRWDHDVVIDEIGAHVERLQEELSRREIPVRIVPGGEVAQTAVEGCGDDALRSLSLGGAGGWILLEPAPGPLAAELLGPVQRIHEAGMGAIVAHPERHAGADLEAQLEALVAQGCLIQWTAAFVAAASPGDLVLRLAERGLLHLLGSDAHSSHAGRPVALSEGFDRLGEVLPAERVEWMAETAPEAIVRGERFEPPAPAA
jgi:protein-tyrosine phosphatase